MSPRQISFSGASVFDGFAMHSSAVLTVSEEGRIVSLGNDIPKGAEEIYLSGGILAPGLVDLQVNGGGGHMVGAETDAAAIADICAVHARLGATSIMPTLITSSPKIMLSVVDAAIKAYRLGTPGLLGLHLEGPFIDPSCKGIHQAPLIRQMESSDFDLLCRAARHLPYLMITISPQSVSAEQIEGLSAAGVIVSLGHSECRMAEAEAAIKAGARNVTHLFNAMPPLHHREPGLVGATLAHPRLYASLIADGVHVCPEVLKIVLSAKTEGFFLVSDAMAVAGTELSGFVLGGEYITRKGGRLQNQTGRLAGADLTLLQAVCFLCHKVGVPIERALSMACRVPAQLIGCRDVGIFKPGVQANVLYLSHDISLLAAWKSENFSDPDTYVKMPILL